MFSFSGLNDDRKVLIGCLLGSFVAYNGFKYLWRWAKNRNQSDYIPIGIVKDLFIYPAKSCKGKKVFALYCGKKGVECGEMEDRQLLVYDGNTGTFYTARQKPQMILVDVEVKEDTLTVCLPDGRAASAIISNILKKRDVRPTYLFEKARQDGLDCGDDISRLLSDFLQESNVRMVLYVSGFHNERLCTPQQSWWKNNQVPKRTDEVAYQDLSPYMIMTQGSLDELNFRLTKKVDVLHFRPEIFVDRCPAWDEDMWSSIRIGEVEFECYKPCDRCVLTTVDPKTGLKDPDNEPLKTLRQFRLAPEGIMRNEFKESPLFGVNAGIIKEGFIHEGQVVYARYKKSPF